MSGLSAEKIAEIRKVIENHPSFVPAWGSVLCDEVERLRSELSAYREIGDVKKIAEMIKAAGAMHHRIATCPLTNPINTIYEEWKRLGAAVIALRKPSPQPVTLSEEDSETLRYLLNERKPITPEMSAKVQQLYHHLGLEW
jgi:hypothetical protein